MRCQRASEFATACSIVPARSGHTSRAGLDDRALQDRRRGRFARVVVEHLERGDGPPRRVGAEALQLRVAPPHLGPLSGRVVDGVVVVGRRVGGLA